MRVAMIDPSLFTLPYDQELAAALGRSGHEVTLFGRRPRPDDGGVGGVRLVEAFYKVAESAPIAALPSRLRLAVKGVDHLWSMTRLIDRLRRLAPAVIHFQWLPLPLVDRRMLGALRRIAPLVLTVHDTNPFNGDPSSGLQVRGFAESFGKFDRIVVHTEQGEGRLRAGGVRPDRLLRVPHGTMPMPYDGADDPMAGELTFVLFGKIKHYKGADILIEAFARMPAALQAQARVRIIGKPYMDLEPLQARVRALGIEARCTIEPRFVPDSEIPAVLGRGCVAVFPYREIDASGVLYQALSLARPLLATRLGSFVELLHDGRGGLLADREDIDGFAAAMARFVADRDFAARCSREVRELGAGAADWDEVARRTEAVYNDVVRADTVASAGTRRATEVSSSVKNTIGGNC